METVELIKIQEMLNNVVKRIEELVEEKDPKEEPLSSPSTKNLMIALAKAQGEYTIAEENKSNPYFKSSYADFKSVVHASRPALTKYGIAVKQDIIDKDDGKWLYTRVSLGDEWTLSKVRIIPPKNDIQSISSTVTYTKRMVYSSSLGVVVGDEDDDGEAAVATSRETFAKGTALNTKYNPKENTLEVITKEQLEELNYELSDYPDIAEMVLDGLKLQNLADMPKTKFLSATKRIREIKNLRAGK